MTSIVGGDLGDCALPGDAARMAARRGREARRIVAGLETPDGSAERLRQAVVCRRGDGREVTLGDLGNAETVCAEHVEIFIPGGKRVRTRIDATLFGGDGA